MERRSLTGTARRRRANADLLRVEMARRPLPAPPRPGAVRGCGPPGRVPVRDRRSKPADHQVAWGPPPSSIFMPGGVRRRTCAWAFLPVGGRFSRDASPFECRVTFSHRLLGGHPSVYCRGAGDERAGPAGITEGADGRETRDTGAAEPVEVLRSQPADNPDGNAERLTGLPKDLGPQGPLSARRRHRSPGIT